jgi:hypothetical protein
MTEEELKLEYSVISVTEVVNIKGLADAFRAAGWSPSESQKELLETLQMVYRKHCLDDESIGWEELGTRLHDTLCKAMTDKGYVEWKRTIMGVQKRR